MGACSHSLDGVSASGVNISTFLPTGVTAKSTVVWHAGGRPCILTPLLQGTRA